MDTAADVDEYSLAQISTGEKRNEKSPRSNRSWVCMNCCKQMNLRTIETDIKESRIIVHLKRNFKCPTVGQFFKSSSYNLDSSERISRCLSSKLKYINGTVCAGGRII